MAELVRLQKHIAALGIASRRKAEELIVDGCVKVNGIVVKELGTKVDPEKDQVEVIGTVKKSAPEYGPVYIMLNKPLDYISSATSDQGASVLELLTKDQCMGGRCRDITERVYPVGRLDKDSEGLLLLTNDGEFTNLLTHPRYEHGKIYEVTLTMPLRKDAREVLQSGMRIDDEFVQGITILKEKNVGRRSIITVELKEGKNRQIKRMFGRLGYDVLALKRTQVGRLKLGVLPTGRWKFVKKEDIL